MPSRVTYWTGIWDPGREGISSELGAVRAALGPTAPGGSVSLGQSSSWRFRDGVVRLSGRRVALLRALGTLVERRGKLTHVWGGLGSWHLLRAVGRRPIVLTVAADERAPDPQQLRRPRILVCESRRLATRIAAVVGPDREVEVVSPGVDLKRFRPTALPDLGPFRLLFASTPADPKEIEGRGIALLVELARLRPEIEVRVLWRPWGELSECRQRIAELAPPPNFELVVGTSARMEAEFARAHAVAALFAEGCGKACPTSVLEGLAAGRPALVSASTGVAEHIAESGAGLVVPRDAAAVAAAVDALRRELAVTAARARALAEREFDVAATIAAYRRIYRTLETQSHAAPA